MSRRSYKDALKSLSVRTGAPLSSLVISFGVLHEITAIVPLIGIFYGAKSLGVGESLVNSIVESDPSDSGVIRKQCRVWVHEGEAWAERVGRRYGIFGFPQTPKGTKFEYDQEMGGKIVGNVADAVLAYGATKALVPARLALSFYLSPAFARRIVDPIRRNITRIWSK